MKYYAFGWMIGLSIFVGWNCTPDRVAPPAAPTPSQWEYKTLVVESVASERTGVTAMAPGIIVVKDTDLNALGQDRWELVSSWLEEETAYPNLGDAKYVTGVQPNIRPKKVVFVFKRHVW